MPELSFCTSCMGRLHHLRQTLPRTLEAAHRFGHRVEVVVLNYNSQDALDEWMLGHCAGAMRDGLVRYVVTREPTHFHTSHAKNVAHRAATGDVVFNLDADNWIGESQIESLLEFFRQHPDSVVVSGNESDGMTGRIGLRRSHFLRMRGYAEEFRGWGREDREFIGRARRCLGLIPVAMRDVDSFLEHGDDERLRSIEEPLGQNPPESDEAIAASMTPGQYGYFCDLRRRSPALAESWRRNNEVFTRLVTTTEIAVNGEDWGRAALLDGSGSI